MSTLKLQNLEETLRIARRLTSSKEVALSSPKGLNSQFQLKKSNSEEGKSSILVSEDGHLMPMDFKLKRKQLQDFHDSYMEKWLLDQRFHDFTEYLDYQIEK